MDDDDYEAWYDWHVKFRDEPKIIDEEDEEE